MRALYRFFAFIFYTIEFTFKCIFNYLFYHNSLNNRLKYRKVFFVKLVNTIGLKIEIFGTIPNSDIQHVFVSNHRSYIDSVVILKNIQAKIVSKKSVKYWPIIGWAAGFAGAIWINRKNSKSKLKGKVQIIEDVKKGNSVLLFPEGTTHKFKRTIRLKKGIFVECANHNVSIAPISIEYLDNDDCWVGNDTFIEHFLECFSKKEIKLAIYFHESIQSNDSEILINYANEKMNEGMTFLQKHFSLKSGL
jgi:lyso-ornithine lipid O-acyltransferase